MMFSRLAIDGDDDDNDDVEDIFRGSLQRNYSFLSAHTQSPTD